MKRFLLLVFSLTATASIAEPSAAQYWERVESMVRTGAITSEGAQQVKLHQRGRKLEERKEVQRELASIHPDLKPLQLKRLKVEPMVLFLD